MLGCWVGGTHPGKELRRPPLAWVPAGLPGHRQDRPGPRGGRSLAAPGCTRAPQSFGVSPVGARARSRAEFQYVWVLKVTFLLGVQGQDCMQRCSWNRAPHNLGAAQDTPKPCALRQLLASTAQAPLQKEPGPPLRANPLPGEQGCVTSPHSSRRWAEPAFSQSESFFYR